MSREIKFRVWHEMCHNFSYFKLEDGSHLHIHGEPEQFTGLLDLNGKEIYEGDIITHIDRRCRDGSKRIYKVIWSEAPLSYIALAQSEYVWLSSMEGCEVIGNIHENPELLENAL